MDEPTDVVARRRGRPRLSANETSVPVTIYLPASEYDGLARESIRRRLSLSLLIRGRISSVKNRHPMKGPIR